MKQPLRITCTWPATEAAPPPELWLAALRDLGLTQGDTPSEVAGSAAGGQAVEQVAGLPRYSLLLPAAEVDRAQRAQLILRLEEALAPYPVAVAITGGDLAIKGPRLVVCDADATLFTCEVIEKIAAHAGTEKEVAQITAAAMRGELDFAASLRARVATLAGLDAKVLDEVRSDVEFSPGAREMVQAFQQSGAKVGVVSGGFLEVVAPLARQIGLDHVMANRFEIREGRLTGQVEGLIVTGEIKAECLRQWAQAAQAPLDQCVAVGDGANDLNMVRAAGLGVAYCAKPALAAAADARIPFANLSALAALAGR